MTVIEGHTVLPRSENLSCGCIVHINAKEVTVTPCHMACVSFLHIMRGFVGQ